MQQYNQPRTLPIVEIRDEAEDLKTYLFAHTLDALPGQFVMLWIPRVNLKPFGIAYLEKGQFGITVSRVGPATEALFKKKTGDFLGFTGPYGQPFKAGAAEHLVLVGGGYGAATIAPLADSAAASGKTVDLIVGARTGERLLYQRRYAGSGVRYHAVTDDGSVGEKGRVTNVLEKLLTDGTVDYIAACGPERMLKSVAEMAQKARIPAEVSIERYMKCGFGVCGACCMDGSGERICVEGTVFPAEHALNFNEFGAYHRARSGRKIVL